MALLRLLLDLQDKWHWRLRVIHCDHGWRADTRANAAFVAETAAAWGLGCEIVRAESPPAGEAAARTWRYGVLAAAARQHHDRYVVTGHTASDRAETLLYNLIRGSGADGLQALTWRRSLAAKPHEQALWLVRPLLGLTRAQTGEFCQTYGMPLWQDATNQDRAYARNRLRLDVLPLLRSQFNPQVDQTLAQTAEILAAEVTYLEQQAQALYGTCVQGNQIQRRSLQSAPLALQRRVMRQVLQTHTTRAPDFEQVEKLVALIEAPNRSQSDPFPGGAIARVDGDWIRLESGEGPNAAAAGPTG